MRIVKQLSAVGFAVLLLAGCSEQTKQETKEMFKETGEAASSAAEDTKENVKKIGSAVEAGVERGKEEFNKPETPAGAPDADADGVPNSQDPQP